MDLKLEVVVVPVSDVDRAQEFYEALGVRMDIDHVGDLGFRVVQLTPPGSECSIIIGDGITSAAPGSLQGPAARGADIEAARSDLVGRGAHVSDSFHDRGGIFHHLDASSLEPGPDPTRGSCGSFATFQDPDANGGVLQEVRQRAPGR